MEAFGRASTSTRGPMSSIHNKKYRGGGGRATVQARRFTSLGDTPITNRKSISPSMVVDQKKLPESIIIEHGCDELEEREDQSSSINSNTREDNKDQKGIILMINTPSEAFSTIMTKTLTAAGL